MGKGRKGSHKKLAPVHPGEILWEDFLMPLGLSMNALALGLRVPATRIAEHMNAVPYGTDKALP
jgi:plasmid maintenance system antidote protein VapI